MKSLQNDQKIIAAWNGELQELHEAIGYVVDVLVPNEDPKAPTPLLDHLKAMPNRVKSLMKKTTASCARLNMGSHWLALNLKPVGIGMGCASEKFDNLMEEVTPIADKVATTLDL
ncbi:hypothetical protein BAE44_0010338 [Dichanthelium oligosanthes]|uniref:Uncharacterized protein n=1 Tax=Dichanthelium oligosanthes TaxID=888268 RepID=A0A1E5VU40_9POAL|nr:hypothetical protein BAE44_0010338 [Dichanthelium oligosanthes]